MKWMGWDWDQLQDCPADLVPVIQEEMADEADRERQRARQR